MLAIRIFESELTAGVISATRWNPGAEMSIDFSKKTRHPFSLGSAAANLHSSYNSGTKSDKMRPIMRPAANRADNNSLFFFFTENRFADFSLNFVSSQNYILRSVSRTISMLRYRYSWHRRFSPIVLEFRWFRWAMLGNVAPFKCSRFRGWTCQDTEQRREGDSVATPHSHSRRGGSIRVHSAHLSLRQNPNPNPARRAGATPAKIVQRF